MKEVGIGVLDEYLPFWLPTQTVIIFPFVLPAILPTNIRENKEVSTILNKATQSPQDLVSMLEQTFPCQALQTVWVASFPLWHSRDVERSKVTCNRGFQLSHPNTCTLRTVLREVLHQAL